MINIKILVSYKYIFTVGFKRFNPVQANLVLCKLPYLFIYKLTFMFTKTGIQIFPTSPSFFHRICSGALAIGNFCMIASEPASKKNCHLALATFFYLVNYTIQCTTKRLRNINICSVTFS